MISRFITANCQRADSKAMCNFYNVLLERHIGRTTSYSTLNITAVMMTAPRLAFGMYAQNGMSRARAIITRDPVQIPPPGVLTPLAQFTAVLENDPVVGIDWTNDPTRLQIPSAIISWFASTGFPPATNIIGSKLNLDNIIKHFN